MPMSSTTLTSKTCCFSRIGIRFETIRAFKKLSSNSVLPRHTNVRKSGVRNIPGPPANKFHRHTSFAGAAQPPEEQRALRIGRGQCGALPLPAGGNSSSGGFILLQALIEKKERSPEESRPE